MIYPGQLLNIPLSIPSVRNMGPLPELRRGSSSPLVQLLQGRLYTFGFYKGDMDGIFSPAVEKSLVQFRLNHGLPPAGFVDSYTWRHLLDESRGTLDSPPYHTEMVLSGLLLLFYVNKPMYNPGDTIHMTLLNINLSDKTIILNYSTSQRYDFRLTYPSGRTLWRWSDDKSFTQALGTISLSPGQSIRYEEEFILPTKLHKGLLHVFVWNTAKQINHIKLNLHIRTS